MKAKLSIVCSLQNNGSYFAVCPELKGCFTQGDTYEIAISNIKELALETIRESLDELDMDFLMASKSKIYSEFEVSV